MEADMNLDRAAFGENYAFTGCLFFVSIGPPV
jgi:hypothetical protein